MKRDDLVLLESFLVEIVDYLTPALRRAEIVLDIVRRRRSEYGGRADAGLAELVDDSRFAVRWNGNECRLGSTVLFRLFVRLARSANHYISIERLLEEVWDGSRSETTVRSAVRNLRRKLEAAGMAELADAIKGQPGHYALLLEGIAQRDELHRDGTAVAPRVHSPRS